MAEPAAINLQHVARAVGLPIGQVQATVELLDGGNTVPFITRYRKDRTGGLDEEQIRRIQDCLAKLRLLTDRKQTILRSIEAQGKLTPELAAEIEAAATTKRLEDLYLPYKPKKQTLATLARSRGLEELAQEILTAAPTCIDLDARAADFVSEDRKVPSAADALLGAGHILAEAFSEQAVLRQKLREILERTGKLVSKRIAPPPVQQAAAAPPATSEPASNAADPASPAAPAAPGVLEPLGSSSLVEVLSPIESPTSEGLAAVAGSTESERALQEADAPAEEPTAEPVEAPAEEPSGPPADAVVEVSPEPVTGAEASAEPVAAEPSASRTAGGQPAEAAPAEPAGVVAPSPVKTEPVAAKPAKVKAAAAKKLSPAQLKKQQALEKRLKALADYFDYEEAVTRIPPHRVLAINRGERTKVLRVRITADAEALERAVDETLVPANHPHAEFLRGCARDALARLVLPSLEREIRREMTDRAEAHAVEVFARNLRNLLLQPPIRDHRVLAVDPGYRSGCKLVALDQFGNVLDHAVIHLVGKSARKAKAVQTVAALVDRYQLKVVVIGNGTACRQTEDFFAEAIQGDLKDRELAYVIVNEAGASVYSTSRLGREEFPRYDATLRGAISIGRRLQDPLSELVKIEPANIGVGLYQHDVKAKHLRESLDGVVESCVNFVGVNVNSASAALLRYVSGMNQLTARRVFEHRMRHGPFRNRQQLKEVAGLGEATFVQAAGFLKIAGGDQPLDATWIHPESYDVAQRVLARLGCTVDDLRDRQKVAALASRLGELDVDAVSKELAVGTMLLADILAQLGRPGRDPREDLPAPIFKKGVLKLENLTPGMELTGTVLNVVDFGAFVDIGMHDSGLVHVSQLANRFVRDPHEVVAVGDVVRVWVVEVNQERRRVSLSMIPPGTKKPERPQRRGGKPEGTAPDGGRPQGTRPEGGKPSERPRRTSAAGKPPRGKGPPRGQGRPPARQGAFQVRSKPKPIVPITERMKSGAEPMRTFGDLAQFFQFKHEAPQDGQPELKDQAQPPAQTPDQETSEKQDGQKESP